MMMAYRIRSFVAGLILFAALAATLVSFLAAITMALRYGAGPLMPPAFIAALGLEAAKLGLPVEAYRLWVRRALVPARIIAALWLMVFVVCSVAAYAYASGPHMVRDTSAMELLARKEIALRSMQHAYDWEEQEYTVSLSYEKRIAQLRQEIAELRTKSVEMVSVGASSQLLGGVAILNELLSALGLLLLRLATAHPDERITPPAPAPVSVMPTPVAEMLLPLWTPAPEASSLCSGPAFVSASAKVDPGKATAWLWPGVLPLGALTLLTGQPKAGKSTIAVAMAAVTSAGGVWPTGERCKPGNVLLLEVEDSFSDTQLRLAAAGADLRRVVVRDREQGPIDLSTVEGMAVLTGQADAMGGSRLVVLSPVLAFFGKSVGGDDAALRQRIAPLLLWAARNKVSVLGLLHPAKNAGKGLESQFAGADAYRRAARSAFVVMPDASDPNPVEKLKRRVLVCAGINGASDDFRLFYRIQGATVDGQSTSRVAWVDDATAQAGANAPPPDGDDGGESAEAGDTDDAQTEIARACAIIDGLLPVGSERSAVEIKVELYDAGLSKGTVGRAAKRMGVESRNNGVGQPATWSR
jgi:putative DNA primase/helicase